MNNYLYGYNVAIALIAFFILLQVFAYLQEIESCPCFNESNNESKYVSSITFMKFYQFLEMISLVIFILMISLYKNSIKGGRRKTSFSFFLRLISILSLMVLLFISGYMSYNSFALYVNAKNDCMCVNQWQKYFIYLEGIFNSIYFLRLLYLFFFVLILISVNFFK